MSCRSLRMPQILKEFLAEFTGLFILLFLGFSGTFLLEIFPSKAINIHNSCVGNKTCEWGSGTAAGEAVFQLKITNIEILMIAIAYGSGLFAAIMIVGHISGAHFNPAYTVALVIMKKFPAVKLLHYIPAQYLSAFCSAVAVHAYHWPHMYTDAGVDQTKQILYELLVTAPHNKISLFTACFDSFLSTFIFVLIIQAISDRTANAIPDTIEPILIVTSFIAILISFGLNCCAVFNPARHFGPKLYAALWIGFKKAFGHQNYMFFWVSQQFCLYLGFIVG